MFTEYRYWGGYYWRIMFKKEESNLDVFVMPSVRHGSCFIVRNSEKLPGIRVWHLIALLITEPPARATDRPKDDCRSLQVEYTVWLCAANSTSDLEAVSGTSFFEPCSGSGWGEIFIKEAPEHGGQPITWDGFWAEGSRFMHNGAARVRLQLRLPGN